MARTARTIISYDLMHAELMRRGYQLQKFAIGQHFTRFTADSGRPWLTRDALLAYPFVTGSAKIICRDKQMSQNFVTSQGVPAAPMLEYPCEDAAMLEFLEAKAPLVVKPIDRGGSKGLALNVTDLAGLHAAIADALRYSSKILLQQQFFGEEVRITVSDGKVVSAILRQTPRVVGDGVSSVAELIVRENHARTALAFEYMSYPQLSADIIPAQWLSDARVPERGEIVELTPTTLVGGGASLYDITDELHETYKAVAVNLTDTLNPDFLVVDLLIKDYRKPATDDNYIFLEFTSAPALKMYYIMRDGKQYDIVTALADKIDAYCSRPLGG